MSIIYQIEHGTPLNTYELARMREVIRDTERKIVMFKETITLETGAYDADWSAYMNSPRLITQAFVTTNPGAHRDAAYGIDVLAYKPSTTIIKPRGWLQRIKTWWKG